MAEKNRCYNNCYETLDTAAKPTSILMMRIFGVLVVIFSVVEFGLGGAASGFLINPAVYNGSWWAGLIPFAVGICGIVTKNRGGVTSIIVLGIIAALVAFAGLIVDALMSSNFSNLTTCIQAVSPYPLSGKTDTSSINTLDASCVSVIKSQFEAGSCYCVSSSASGCLVYAPASKYGCDDIMVMLPILLKSSTAICSAIIFCLIVLASIGCSIVCCSPAVVDPPAKDVVGINTTEKAF